MDAISNNSAKDIAIDYVRKRKNTEKVDISMVERKNAMWIVRGTCPIDLEGHPWAEKFEVIIDQKGKVISLDLSLL
jgi:hypothetical protein